MRFERITLQRFGHFDLRELEMGNGLVIVHGANEAGKTTLLQGLRYFLFKIPVQNDFGYRFSEMGYRDMEIRAELVEASGARLRLARVKSTGATLRGERVEGEKTSEVTEAALTRLLQSTSKEIYESVFGFTLGDLESGARLLEQSGIEDLIAGTSLGGSGDLISRAGEEMEGRMDELFRPRASSRRINSLVSSATQVTREIREAELGQPQLKELREALALAQAESARISGELGIRRERQSRVQRHLAALPDLRQLELVRARLTELGAPLSPLAAATSIQTTIASRNSAQDGLQQLERELEDRRARAAEAEIDEDLLEKASRITVLWKSSERVRDCRLRQEREEQELDSEERQIREALEELAPGRDLQWLAEHRVPPAIRSQIQSLSAAAESGRTDLESVTRDLEKSRRAHTAIERKLEPQETHPAAAEVPELASSRRSIADKAQRLAHVQTEILTEESKINARVARLSPRTPASLAAIDSVLPTKNYIETERGKLHRLEENIREDEHKVVDRRTRQETIETQLSSLSAAGKAPSLEELNELRRRRDELWRLARRAWLERDDVTVQARKLDPDRELPEAVDHAISSADAAADSMRQASDQVQMQVDLSGAIQARERAESRLAELSTERERWQTSWEQAWLEVGITSPDRPEVMLGWLEEVRSIREQGEALLAKQFELEQLSGELENWRDRVASELSLDPQTPDEALSLLEEHLERGQKRSGAHEAMSKQLEDLSEEIAELEATAKVLRGENGERAAAFAEIVAEMGIEHDDVATGAEYLAALEDLSRRARQLTEKRGLHATDRKTVQEFESDAVELAGQLSRAAQGSTAEETIEGLHNDLEGAQAEKSERDTLDELTRDAQRRLSAAREVLDGLDHDLEQLREEHGAQTDEELVERAERTLVHEKLQSEIEEVEVRLTRGLGTGKQRRAHEEELTGVDLDKLESEFAHLQDEIDTLESQAGSAREDVGAASRSLEALGGDLGAQKNAHLAELTADLDSATDEYLTLGIARQVLEHVVAAYARDHQPALLARTSALFCKITGGRYVRVESPPGEQRLLCTTRDGELRRVEQLSTGTREQLFLALRLAYVLEYCEHSEPLPVVMDDVLVNFDPERTQATLAALGEIAQQTQVIYLTCHPGVVDWARAAVPGVATLEL